MIQLLLFFDNFCGGFQKEAKCSVCTKTVRRCGLTEKNGQTFGADRMATKIVRQSLLFTFLGTVLSWTLFQPAQRKNRVLPSLYFVALFCLATACDKDENAKKFIPYKGALEEAENVQVLFSENAILKVKVNTAKQIKQPNEDKVFPKPVFIDFYDPTGKNVITTLRSDSGRLDNQTGIYRVMGNVKVVKNLTQERLTSDELTWNPATQKVYTDKKVKVESIASGELIRGDGLDAAQDFSKYSIRKPTGFFNAPAGVN